MFFMILVPTGGEQDIVPDLRQFESPTETVFVDE